MIDFIVSSLCTTERYINAMMALPTEGDVYTNLRISPPEDCGLEFHGVKTLSEMFVALLESDEEEVEDSETDESDETDEPEIPEEHDSIFLDISYMDFDEEAKNQMILFLQLLDLTGVKIVLVGLPYHLQAFKGYLDVVDDDKRYDSREDSLTIDDINTDVYPGIALDLQTNAVQQHLLSHGINSTIDAVIEARKTRETSDFLRAEPAWVMARRKSRMKKAKTETPKTETQKAEVPKVEEELVEDAAHAA